MFMRPHWERAVGQPFLAPQPYGRLALLIQSRSFNSVVAFFKTSKSLQLMEPLGEIRTTREDIGNSGRRLKCENF